MKKIVKLTESDLTRIIKRVIEENEYNEEIKEEEYCDSCDRVKSKCICDEPKKVRTKKMVRDMEGDTKSNRKEYNGKGRQAPPPPSFKR